MYRMTTVCTGNICRSPMAAYLLRRAAQNAGLNGVEVDSAGIIDDERGKPVDPRARTVLEREGIDPSDHSARQFHAEELSDTDLILALDLNHLQALRRMAPDDKTRAKIHLLREYDPAMAGHPENDLGIYDPWYGNQEDFEITYRMIRDAIPGVIETVAAHP